MEASTARKEERWTLNLLDEHGNTLDGGLRMAVCF
jgi:hypothetical protein